MSNFKLILVDTNADVVDAFKENFKHFENVEFFHGKFEDVEEYDCMVSPANSFGIMDGGIDEAIIKYFGEDLQRNVLENILTFYSGMQPVGTSMLVKTGNEKHPYLAHTPTMQVPLSIINTDNVYYAMSAMLNCIKTHNNILDNNPEIVLRFCRINKVLVPGFGTLTGRMKPRQATQQMALAYEHFLNQPTAIDEMDWELAWKRFNAIRCL